MAPYALVRCLTSTVSRLCRPSASQHISAASRELAPREYASVQNQFKMNSLTAKGLANRPWAQGRDWGARGD